MQLTLNLLPYALLIHLALAIWFYGDPRTLVSGPISYGMKSWRESYTEFLMDKESWDPVGLIPKLLRDNVFPVAAFLLIFAGLKLFWYWFGPAVMAVVG